MSLPDRRDLIADAAISTVASAGLRGLTHRAVDTAAGLPAGSTSYYFRTRSALISACYLRLAALSVADVDRWQAEHGAPDPDSAAEALAALLHHWLTAARDRQLARFELSLEATRRPELRADLETAGLAARSRATTLLASLGAPRPEQAAELLVAWTDGLLYDRLAGAPAASRPAPDVTELTSVVRRMLAAVLAA
ncbi:TetR/AcrR family transcriptional regulator [Streptomyces microflavus]|uniref:TetR family transcriptional regulator n=2 Tax=Streptomyces microflavus TaxID=1919 RepID=A0A6N9VLP0_STRMI|nr:MULTISPECIES: TetR/AcrR family transcriptional regulator [Streptomyces]AGK75724.1 Putative TetR-family transcriptional regulator [Streptomyces microflavus DSM 40593]MBK5990327.1 TetR/AcrR family transcriptional regulator [Streptomyces sp. MBT58]MBW3357230.1 TetR/AcrR family transcriptional regulator [Streptomyces sp. 09ZI22]MDX2401528.1 TetR/AcrR family transcriptional regulator [Streptomyces microflavus]MEE1730357.1 TetR family transcriptional regulator [Streptomyces sp. BE282]